MADNGPTIEDILASYGGGTDPVVNTQAPSVPLPAGSVAMQQRGPWMRDYLHPQVADFLAGLLQYGPMALGSRTGVKAGNAPAWVEAVEKKALHAPGHYDWGITGGNPDPVSAYAERLYGNPAAIYERSSGDLGTRPGTTALKPNWPDSAIGRIWAERPDMVNIEAGNNNTHASGPFTPESWSPGMRSTADIQRNMRVSPDKIGGESANGNYDQVPYVPSIAELLARPGVRPAQEVVWDADPTMIAAKKGPPYYRGPNPPANDHPPGPYDRNTFNSALQKQREPAEDAWIKALLDKDPNPPRDPFR